MSIQVLDEGIQCVDVFDRMEKLKANNFLIYSYIVCGPTLDYLYNSLYLNEELAKETFEKTPCCCEFKFFKPKIVKPDEEMIAALKKFEEIYSITKLSALPWSVIFHN